MTATEVDMDTRPPSNDPHMHRPGGSFSEKHRMHGGRERHTGGSGHAGHGGHDHAAMIADFRRRFWVSLALTMPILALSPMIQSALGLEGLLAFGGDAYVLLGLSTLVFFYGGWPFLAGLFSELRQRQPGMMTLIALATASPTSTPRRSCWGSRAASSSGSWPP
jgi:cation transport ATPase